MKEVVHVVDQIDNSSTFKLDELLKPFKNLGINDLNKATSQISLKLHERALARQRESKRFLDISQNLLNLTVKHLKLKYTKVIN